MTLSDFKTTLIDALSRARFAVLAVFALVALAPDAKAQGMFSDYAGTWNGTGSITIANGGTERIRCRCSNTVGNNGNSLQQALRCASDSYRFDLNSDVIANGSNISGTWGETSRGVNGTLSGRISGGQVTALVETNAFAAQFNMTAKAGRQTVAITSQGELRAVNITLTKGGGE